MGINKKHVFDSLNNDINLYKDTLEIVEGILKLYRGYFDLKDRELNNKHLIIDYGVNIIEKYKKRWIELFDNILVFKSNKSELMIKEIKVEDFDYIIHGMEKFFLEGYGLFLSSWDLEVVTFGERNSNIKNVSTYMIEQSKEAIQNFNVKYIKEVIEVVISEVHLDLNKVIKAFNRSILTEKDDLKYFIINEASIALNVFYDEVNLVREAILRKFDDLQGKIKVIIEEKLIKKTLEQINKVTEEKIGLIIGRYKEKLNKYYILTIGLRGKPIDLREKTIGCSYNNKLITKESLYRRCGAVLQVELKYLQFVRAIGVECFRIIEQEAEAVFNNVFDCEFYSGIHDVKFSSDLKNLIEAYRIKGDFILGNMVMGLLKDFIHRYHEIIPLMLKNRNDRIEKLYVFKPITYMGNFNIYEPSVVVQLQRLLNDIYASYDLKTNKSQELKEIKRVCIGLNEEIENIVEKFNSSLEGFEITDHMKSFFKDEKIIIHRSITALKSNLWSVLNSRFITVFNCFNGMVGRSIEELEKEIKLFENNASYSDY